MSRISFIFIGFMFFCLPAFPQDSTWSLNKCIDHGLNNNIFLQQTQLSNENNKISLEQARANRIPTLSGSASQVFSFGRSIDPTTNQYVNNTIRTNTLGIGGSVTLFNGFQNRNLIRQSSLNYEAGNLNVEAARNDLKISIIESYFQILFAQEQVVNALTQIETTQSQLERVEKLVASGSVPELNLLQMKSQLSNNKLALVNAENQVYLSKITLMQLINIPVTDNFQVEKPLEEELVAKPANSKRSEEIYRGALETQPGIKSLQLRTESSLAGLKAAKGSKLPRLSLNGNLFTNYSSAKTLNSSEVHYTQQDIGYLQNDPSQIVSAMVPQNSVTRSPYPFAGQLNDNLSQSLSLNLSIPILSNKVARSNIARAKINKQIAELDEQNGKNELRKVIEQAFAEMKSAENSFNASQESLFMLEQTYLNSEKRFNLGLTSPADFLIDKNNYFTARTNLSFAKYQYILKSRVLDFYQTNQL